MLNSVGDNEMQSVALKGRRRELTNKEATITMGDDAYPVLPPVLSTSAALLPVILWKFRLRYDVDQSCSC